jgi:hypothetical protein
MPSRHLLPALALLVCSGCFMSNEPDPAVEPLVDECVATGFAWRDGSGGRDVEPGYVVLFANYPLFSPHYQLELYGADLLVEIDERYDARYGATDWGGEGIEDVVFGRDAGEESWRVLADPDASCPPRPDGVEWPTDT